MNNKKILIQIIEKNGFIVKGKTKENWNLCYEMATLKEKYNLNVSPITKKQIKKVLLQDIEYWSFVKTDQIITKKVEREIEKQIKKMKIIIGEIDGISKL